MFWTKTPGDKVSDCFSIVKHINPYDGHARPDTWLQDYFWAYCIAKNGNSLVDVRYLPLMLQNTARSWINELPENSIHNWYDMQSQFFQNFKGTYKTPCIVGDLVSNNPKKLAETIFDGGLTLRTLVNELTIKRQLKLSLPDFLLVYCVTS